MKVLKFYADWCSPCRALSLELDKETLPMTVEAVNVELAPSTAVDYNVRKIPTLVFVDDEGVELARMNGGITVALVKEKMDELQRDKTD